MSPRASFSLGVLALLLARRTSRRPSASAATRAYLALRRLLAARIGGLSPAIPPFEVARLFGHAVPQASGDARRVVSIYCASAFGGRPLDPAEEREIKERIGRLKKLA